MTRESDVAAILRGDAALMALLTGNVYTDEEVGIVGFRRGDDSPTNSAFDAKGELKPCAVVRQGSEASLSNVRSSKDKITAVVQPIEIFFYQHRDKDVIVQAVKRSYALLENVRLGKTYPLIWIADSPVYYDTGPVSNSTTMRQEWRCHFMKEFA